MLIINHKDISSVKFEDINCIEDIKQTSPNSIVYFDFDIDILKYCQKNSIDCAVKITSIKEAIFSNILDAKFIISEQNLAILIQPIAENYMFDCKNLAIINSDEHIENLAKKSIDGVIYR